MSSNKSTKNEDLGFADLLGEVKLLSSDRVESTKPKPRPIPNQTQLDNRKVMETLAVSPIEHEEMQPGDVLSYAQPGVQKQVFRKLKRGQYSVEAELDLHGLNQLEAQEQLNGFVEAVRAEGIRCVQIIHGKGYGSTNKGPVIKPLVNRWLQQRAEVLAFCSARPVDGGTGAVYVLLKSN